MWLWQFPAILLTFLTWLHAPPVSLADAAAREAVRRQQTPPSVRKLTNDDVNGQPRRPIPSAPVTEDAEAPPKTALAAGAEDAAKPGSELRDEAWWRTHLSDARAALERDLVLADALQSSVNALTTDWSARDDPAQRQQLFDRRTRVVNELEAMKERIEADRTAIRDLEEAARMENVPAGWLR